MCCLASNDSAPRVSFCSFHWIGSEERMRLITELFPGSPHTMRLWFAMSSGVTSVSFFTRASPRK